MQSPPGRRGLTAAKCYSCLLQKFLKPLWNWVIFWAMVLQQRDWVMTHSQNVRHFDGRSLTLIWDQTFVFHWKMPPQFLSKLNKLFFLSFTALPPLKESRKPPEIVKPFKPSSPAKEVRSRKPKYHWFYPHNYLSFYYCILLLSYY